MINGGPDEILVRFDLQPGDIGRVIEMHGILYADEYGFDYGFEAYVAESLGEFGRNYQPDRDRLWIAEQGGMLAGSIGILGRDDATAQLRWYLVHPRVRGRGLGSRLLAESLAFCRGAGYRSVYLWTVHPLTGAARRYESAGFQLTEEKPDQAMWGQTLKEQRYDLALD